MTDISILSFDVSHNCLGRAHMLAGILNRRFEVEIIGPATTKDGIWMPCRDEETIPINWTPPGGRLGRRMVKDLLAMVRGKIIYAVKPRFSSYGVGLMARRRLRVPLVLDIDDWEMGFYLSYLRSTMKSDISNLGNLNNLATTWIMERFVGRADAITVSSRFLQSRFGGVRITHTRDTDVLDPARFDRAAIREARGWTDNIVAMFLGTPAPHKGIDTLLAAAAMVEEPGFRVVIAGAGPRSTVWGREKAANGAPVQVIGQIPFGEMPGLLAAADIAVVPQHAEPATVGQVPAKIVDAMAMGRAIVASAISDIPEMIEGCGLLCRPADPDDLAAKLSQLAGDPEMRRVLGEAARERCVTSYSHDSAEEPLCRIFEDLAGGLSRPA